MTEHNREEKLAFAREHNLEHLRECLEEGYECEELYVKQRAKIEHPGYKVDFGDTADWEDIDSPSPETLSEAKKVGGRVVWLTKPATRRAYGNPEADEDIGFALMDFVPTEGVVIREYLGEYDLAREM